MLQLTTQVRRALAVSSLIGAGSLCLLGLGLLGGCSNDECPNYEGTVVTFADDDADFAAYQTFAIRQIDAGDVGAGGAGGSGASLPDDVRLNLELANDAAAAELTDLGLDEVDPDQEPPDLWVFSAGATKEEEGVYWYCVPGWYWWGYGYYLDPCAWLLPIDFEYTTGTLLVGVADAETEQPVFGGLVQGVLECSTDIEQSIEDSVAAIFDDWTE